MCKYKVWWHCHRCMMENNKIQKSTTCESYVIWVWKYERNVHATQVNNYALRLNGGDNVCSPQTLLLGNSNQKHCKKIYCTTMSKTIKLYPTCVNFLHVTLQKRPLDISWCGIIIYILATSLTNYVTVAHSTLSLPENALCYLRFNLFLVRLFSPSLAGNLNVACVNTTRYTQTHTHNNVVNISSNLCIAHHKLQPTSLLHQHVIHTWRAQL